MQYGRFKGKGFGSSFWNPLHCVTWQERKVEPSTTIVAGVVEWLEEEELACRGWSTWERQGVAGGRLEGGWLEDVGDPN